MKRRVCLVYTKLSTFVDLDCRILSEAFDVMRVAYRGKRDLWRLARAVRACDISLSWFASGHAAASVSLSRLFGKRSVVIVAGWDVAAMPEIPYGAMLSPKTRRRTTATLERADCVLAVSEANRKEALQWVDREIRVVPLGVDTSFFGPGGAKEETVTTVASVTHEPIIRTKGLDIFLQVARRLPEVPFSVVGRHAPECEAILRSLAPHNVAIVGWLEWEGLRSTFRRTMVYAQLSAHESFGLALAEAMACECRPVVSDCGSLPELVGPSGHVTPYGDVDAATEAVRAALKEGGSPEARERIAHTYPIEARREQLLGILETL